MQGRTCTGVPQRPSIPLGTPPTNLGKWYAGMLAAIAGELTMAIGVAVVGSALGEIAAAQVAAVPTFGLSEVLALIHAPVVLAIGGLIFAGGAGLTYFGGKTMWESGVLQDSYQQVDDILSAADA